MVYASTQPSPKILLNNINRLNRLLNKCRQQGYLPGDIKTSYFKVAKVFAIKNVEKSLEVKRLKFTLKRDNNIIRYIVPQIKLEVPKS